MRRNEVEGRLNEVLHAIFIAMSLAVHQSPECGQEGPRTRLGPRRLGLRKAAPSTARHDTPKGSHQEGNTAQSRASAAETCDLGLDKRFSCI